MTDLPYCTSEAVFTSFSDDTTILIRAYDHDTLQAKAVIENVTDWLKSNKLLLDFDKTLSLNFRRCCMFIATSRPRSQANH